MSPRDRSPVRTSSPRQPSGKDHWNPYNLTLLQLGTNYWLVWPEGNWLPDWAWFLLRFFSPFCHRWFFQINCIVWGCSIHSLWTMHSQHVRATIQTASTWTYRSTRSAHKSRRLDKPCRMHERIPPWRLMYATTAMLSFRIRTWWSLTNGRKFCSAKWTDSISKQFMCQRFWSLAHTPNAGLPSQRAPQPDSDASMVTTIRLTTLPIAVPCLYIAVPNQVIRDMNALWQGASSPLHARGGTRSCNHSCNGFICSKPSWQAEAAAAIRPSSLWNFSEEPSCLAQTWPMYCEWTEFFALIRARSSCVSPEPYPEK